VKLTVLVRPKVGILDPQGEAVRDSLVKLGFPVERARVGRLVELDLAGDDPVQARRQAERMCAELLANPLIESYEVIGEPAGVSERLA
jgi:phosphoribosylformylglycinamidine synthase